MPRANVEFLAIKDAWFSGSMNYVGRARDEARSPQYEATYEINASLEISVPEFHGLVSHEVVPGHVTTFAYVQHLYTLGEVGIRGHGADHELALLDPGRGDRQQRGPDGLRRHRARSSSRTTTSRSACCFRSSRTTPRTRPPT